MAPNLDTLVENVITCPVCLKHFDQPRMLPCLHTFCFQCIQQMTLQNNGLLECPNHDGTTVEENAIVDLPSNEDLCKLMQLIDRPTSVVPKCYRCDNTDAEYWCESDCKHGFCGRCWDSIHETGQYRSHTKLPIKDKPPEMPACKDHTPEEKKGIYWCEGCSKEICGNCQQLKHKDHKFIIITDFVKDVQQQQENGLQSVQLCLNYRTDRADKMVTEIEDESKINQEKVTTTMATLRQLIDRQEEALLAKIRNEEQNDKKPIQEHKKNLQSEQQGLIRQILDVIAIQKDKQPKKLLEAKRTFEDYVTNMNARLVELKPWTRKKRQIFGIDKVNELQRTIENMELAEEPKYTNDKLQQIINNSTDKSKLSLVNLQLKDMDMEIVANEMAINKALKTLELYTNQIGDLGAQTLADALRENTTLTNLQLHENQIGSDGLEHFADALRTNKSLDKLALYKNNITDETAQEIADGLKLNEKMEKQIREINVIPRPTYTNPALTQRIANNGNNTTLDLRSSNYTDDDMLIVADMLKDNTVVTHLYLGGNQIGDSGAQFLSELLKANKKLTRVDLYTNKIGDLGAQYLADALKANTTLTVLYLYTNQIGDQGAQHLGDALKTNQKLQELYLNQNQIGNQGAQHLAEGLKSNKSLTILNLQNNKIGDQGAQKLADALKVNQKLQQLDLRQNQIGDQGAQHLGDALKVNQALIHLYVGNQITDNGAQKFADALKTNRTLTYLNLSQNQIGDNGAQYLGEALKVNKVITSLYLYYNKISAGVQTNLKQQDNRLYFG